MRAWPLLALLLAFPLAGCAEEPATFRFQASLARAMTADEAQEFRDVTGVDPAVQTTLVGCGPEVDPYQCNEHFVQVASLTQTRCEDFVQRLLHRPYWRSEPRCIDDANRLED